MGLEIVYDEGQTPLDEDEIEGLLISTITTRGELDEFEQQNIEQAVQWTLSKSFRAEQVLSEKFIKDLHKRMYGDVWKWAGTFRKSEKNLGVKYWEISPALQQLTNDANYWIANEAYLPDEMAIRFTHRLVSIHCFANGNGRHSRLIADLIINKLFDKPVFSWGAASLNKKGQARIAYIQSLKDADKGDYSGLLAFARH